MLLCKAFQTPSSKPDCTEYVAHRNSSVDEIGMGNCVDFEYKYESSNQPTGEVSSIKYRLHCEHSEEPRDTNRHFLLCTSSIMDEKVFSKKMKKRRVFRDKRLPECKDTIFFLNGNGVGDSETHKIRRDEAECIQKQRSLIELLSSHQPSHSENVGSMYNATCYYRVVALTR